MATIISQNGTDEKKLNEANQSQDVVDHCAPLAINRPLLPSTIIKSETQTNRTKKILVSLQKNLHYTSHNNSHDEPSTTTATTHHRRKSAFDHLPIFHFQRKRGGSAPVIHTVNASATTTTTAGKGRPAFVKSSSIARLFGNTYNTKQHHHHSEYDPTQASNGKTTHSTAATNQLKKPFSQQSSSSSSSHHHHPERFQACENTEDITISDQQPPSNVVQSTPHFGGDTTTAATPFDHPANPFRSLSRGLGRLFWKKSYSVSISEPDPEFKVAYLGNVLTGWAKGMCGLFVCFIYFIVNYTRI